MNADRLSELHVLVTFLRKRVWYVAHYDVRTGAKLPKVDWGSYHRGWRWQMLLLALVASRSCSDSYTRGRVFVSFTQLWRVCILSRIGDLHRMAWLGPAAMLGRR